MQATSTFAIDTWKDDPIDERDGVTLSRAHVFKTFHGDIEGQSTAELLMANAQEGSAAYVGFERFTCRIGDRSGTFVLHHSATMSSAGQSGTWTVVPDSGAGELQGIRGSGRIDIAPDGTHTLIFDYDLG